MFTKNLGIKRPRFQRASVRRIDTVRSMCSRCRNFLITAEPPFAAGGANFGGMHSAANPTSLRIDVETTHHQRGPYTPLQSVIAKPKAKQRGPPRRSTLQSIGVHICTHIKKKA